MDRPFEVARRLRFAWSPRARRYARVRHTLAARHLRGRGLEIGALHLPLTVPDAAEVRYVDRYDLDGLRGHYPELAGERLVAPDLVVDGERLGELPAASEDFVIANHMIEHCEDPLATLEGFAHVLRPGGILFLAVPDAGHGIDVHRTRTPFEHVLEDYRRGPEHARRAHYREYTAAVDVRLGTLPPGKVDDHAELLEAMRYSIHFHAWEPDGFRDLLARARDEIGLPLTVVEMVRNEHEFVVIARRDATGGAG
jgi:SAM-dependent methyltransferase